MYHYHPAPFLEPAFHDYLQQQYVSDPPENVYRALRSLWMAYHEFPAIEDFKMAVRDSYLLWSRNPSLVVEAKVCSPHGLTTYRITDLGKERLLHMSNAEAQRYSRTLQQDLAFLCGCAELQQCSLQKHPEILDQTQVMKGIAEKITEKTHGMFTCTFTEYGK